MITKEISEVAVEINSIFENMSSDILNKIPKNLINFFKENASKTYTFKYDNTKTLAEQDLLPKTKGIISLIYRDYLCNETEKEEYIKQYNKVLNLVEQEKSQIYNPNDLFKAKQQQQNKIDTNLPVIQKKDSFFKKIINKIKNLF